MSESGRLARLLCALGTLILLLPTVAAAEGYQRPPQVLADMVEAPQTPWVDLSPDRDWMVLIEVPTLIELSDLAGAELRLAGLRINPATYGWSRNRYARKLTLKNRESLKETVVTGLPDGARLDDLHWAPDSKSIAFSVTADSGISLWVAAVSDGKARRVGDFRLSAAGGDPIRWMPDGRSLLVATIPSDHAAPPASSAVPTAPMTQENDGTVAPARTYQDLLKSDHDGDLFEHYLTAQLVRVGLDGKARTLGEPGLAWDFESSPDGRYLHVQMLQRPFSFLVPSWRFPRTIQIWNSDGKLVKAIADLPLQDQVPLAFDSVPTGPRSVHWRSDRPATLAWVEARDGGDSRTDAEVRDELLALDAPFDDDPTSLARLELRFRGVEWGSDELALVDERWWKTRKTRTWVIAPGKEGNEATLLFDRSSQDRYGDPGTPVTVPSGAGGEILLTSDDGEAIYLIGEGASPEGNRPFLDRLELKTQETERLWRSEAPYYERPVAPLDTNKGLFLTRRESPEQPPNYFTRDLETGKLRQLTEFPHPTPELAGVTKELLRYDREDGVQLTGTLYLPAGYNPETDGRLPLLVWAYPREFKSASDAGQVTDSPYRFDRVGWWSPLVFLAAGYAVLDDATMPIIGEGDEEPNDMYVEQLVASAAAAIETVAARGVADPDRAAIGGHSYGAFMAANLLAHSDLFAAGIARSGAYNRTLTPFGFQAEERTLWEAPEIYFAMSPFMHADKINEPLLLIHGDADNNSGTFPLQSRRFYHALKGHGAIARLVMLPEESHGYRARESVLHMLWEMNRWLDLHVKPEETDRAVGAEAASSGSVAGGR